MKSVILALSVATAYVPANNTGSIGEPVIAGLTVAVPRTHRHLLRQWVRIDGREYYVNDICGPGTTAVDIAHDNRAEAREYGRRRVTVEVVR